jgi:ABC-type amino acid transport substrate-binding protein
MLIFSVWTLWGAAPAMAQRIALMVPVGGGFETQSAPPSYVDHIASELIRREARLHLVRAPWSRIISGLDAGEPMVTLPMLRLPSREDKYQWITNYLRAEYVYISRTDPATNSNAAVGDKSVGVLRNSAMELDLQAQNIKNLMPFEYRALPLLLQSGRINLWYSARHEALWAWQSLGLGPPPVVGATIAVADNWLVGARSVPPDLVLHLRALVAAIKQDDEIDGTAARYFLTTTH